MRNLFLLIILLSCKIASAQNTYYGTLLDSASGQPIPFANVLEKGTFNGKQTDEHGSFSIQVQNANATLVFTCIGYKTREVKTGTSRVLKVLLVPSSLLLNEVTITSAPACIQKDLSLMCADFEFCDNYLLVLAYRDVASPARLMLLDEMGNNIHTLYVPKKMESLYRDVFGRVHIISNDSAWQVYFDYEKMQLLFPATRLEMQTAFMGIDLFFAGKLFTRMYTYHGQKCDFIYAFSGSNINFYHSEDKNTVTRIQTNYDLQYFLTERRRQRGYNYSTDYIKQHLTDFQSHVRLSPKDSLGMQPLSAQIVQHYNAVWVFDFDNDKAVRFDERILNPDSTVISFHHNPGWQGDIIRDEATDDLYTTYENNGKLKVVRLHDRTFDIEQEWEIDDKPFPVNVRIRNGVLYFLWIDRAEYGANRMLYRYRL